jgi:ribose transport system substrate-binding protein
MGKFRSGPAAGGLRTFFVAAFVCLSAFAVSACGGSSDSTGSSTASGGDSASAGVEQAEKIVAQYSQAPTDVGVTEPLGKMPPKGSTVWYLPCPTPACQASQKGLEEAAGILGVSVHIQPQGATPASNQSAWDTTAAAAPPPDAVHFGGTDVSTVAPQLKSLAAAGVPTVASGSALLNNPKGGTDNPDVTFDLLPLDAWAQRVGRLMADWTVADSQGDAKILYANLPDFVVFKNMYAAFDDEYKKLCQGCTDVKLMITSFEDIGTTLPGKIVSEIQRDPAINYVITPLGDQALGVPQALKAAGITGVKIVSQAGTKANMEYIANGEQAVDVETNNQYLGWKAMDIMARLINGESTSPDLPPIPTQFLTKETLHVNSSTGEAELPGYQDTFKQLWGVGGQ